MTTLTLVDQWWGRCPVIEPDWTAPYSPAHARWLSAMGSSLAQTTAAPYRLLDGVSVRRTPWWSTWHVYQGREA